MKIVFFTAALAVGALHAAVSGYVRIVPRTHTYNASNVIVFRMHSSSGSFIIFR